ncbi:hypothetical protein P2318_22100 [Myxococcaceae bacterium GXIMD 01537]
MDVKLLGIYLKDHLASSSLGLSLARRAERENRGNAVGESLSALLPELEEDHATLLRVMRLVGVAPDRFKLGAVWLAERLGMLKLNGRLVSYSPLSRVVELEGVIKAVAGKRSVWRALGRLARAEKVLETFDFSALAARAEAQLQGLERQLFASTDTAFFQKAVPTRLTPALVEGGG